MPNLNDEFPQHDDIIFLNHAGVAPWPRRTAQAVEAFAQENITRGPQHYARWEQKEAELRKQIQTLINAPATGDIALLKNTSEALSTVAYGLDWQSGDSIVISNHEFPSNRIVWESLRSKGVTTRLAEVDGDNREAAIFAQVDESTRLISVSSVQFASSLRLDLAQIGEFCRTHNILFCVDAIQSIGALPFDVQQIQADFAMADAHKWMLGPEGTALFYSHPDAREQLHLSQYGWRMLAAEFSEDWQIAPDARRFECGSPNMLGIHALSASLSLLQEIGMPEIERRLLDNVTHLLTGLREMPFVEILSVQTPGRHGGIVTFRRRDMSSEALFQALRAQQVICAHRGGGVRFAPHFYTPQEKLDRALALVANLPA